MPHSLSFFITRFALRNVSETLVCSLSWTIHSSPAASRQLSTLDLVIISSSEPDVACYVETKNLDGMIFTVYIYSHAYVGETNLKIHRGISQYSHVSSAKQCSQIKCYFDAEPPSPHMYNFLGSITIPTNNGEEKEEGIKVPLGITNLLLRGCILRNTAWTIGIVVNTGEHTKLMMNSGMRLNWKW